ncbi:hypothetical protein B0H66DRAFT_614217 [Apodospora peruviana]|uniref:Uncharacterized protein n=1 Tax=Apodospora peruviana TaxID=516989 RepID=A0AAE0HS93_9PEZI|nr:hypothetical protein B0H66DRAFT_614217 [Apodospora peruviana]
MQRLQRLGRRCEVGRGRLDLIAPDGDDWQLRSPNLPYIAALRGINTRRKLDDIGNNQEYVRRLLEILFAFLVTQDRNVFNVFEQLHQGSDGDADAPTTPLAAAQLVDSPAMHIFPQGRHQQQQQQPEARGLQLTRLFESRDTLTSISCFLVKLASVAMAEYPWDNKVLGSSQYRENTASHKIYTLICHLTEVSGGHQWATYSIQGG